MANYKSFTLHVSLLVDLRNCALFEMNTTELIQRLANEPMWGGDAELVQMLRECRSLIEQQEKDLNGNQEWINSLCEKLCKMEDALGFKNDCYDKKGQWVPTIGPWLERVRDLLAAEGELGDAKERIEQQIGEMQPALGKLKTHCTQLEAQLREAVGLLKTVPPFGVKEREQIEPWLKHREQWLKDKEAFLCKQ